MKFLLVVISVLVLPFGNQVDSTETKRKERQLLKDSAFCSCLFKINKEAYLLLDERSASMMFQKSKYSVAAHEKVDSLVTMHLDSFKVIESIPISQCLDFYNSKELDDYINTLDSHLILD